MYFLHRSRVRRQYSILKMPLQVIIIAQVIDEVLASSVPHPQPHKLTHGARTFRTTVHSLLPFGPFGPQYLKVWLLKCKDSQTRGIARNLREHSGYGKDLKISHFAKTIRTGRGLGPFVPVLFVGIRTKEKSGPRQALALDSSKGI